jgi:uncharacterized protein YqeY
MVLSILQEEMIAAMKAKKKLRKEVISSLIGAIKKVAIDEKCKDNITEELVNKVILKEKKTMQEMIDTCPANRPLILAEYKQKLDIINEFVPKMMSEEEIRNIIKQNLEELVANGIDTSPKAKGMVMKNIAPTLKGKADMGMVNKILSDILK